MKKQLIIGLIIGFLLGGYFMPHIQEAEIVADNHIISEFDTNLFNEVYDLIKRKYVSPEVFSEPEPFEYGMIKGLIYGLDDPYSSFMTPEENKDFIESLDGNFEGIGAELTIKSGMPTIVTPLKNSPAAKSGLLPGDVIIKVDGKEIQNMPLREVVKLIRGESDTEVVLSVYRPSEIKNLDISIKRGVIEIPSVESKIIEKDGKKIAHIEINQFGSHTDLEFNKQFQEMISKGSEGIILDLRFNGGGFLEAAVKVLSVFFEEKKNVVSVKTRDTLEERIAYPTSFSDEKIPVVVLQNKGSASASEILSAALQDYERAVVVGEQSFGKGTVQEVIDLPGGSSLRVTIAKWLTPNGNEINEKGVSPDIIVEKTEEDYKSEKNPQLDKAIEELIDQINKK